MADFSALKTAIQTYIKQNGNEEIKGDILQEILLSMVTTLGDSAINDLVTALANEVAARQNADGTLQQNITNEATARGNADTALGGRIDDEATARANGDTALSNRLGSTITAEHPAAEQIGEEAEAREAADTALQGLIDGITDNIENGYVYAGIATPSSTPVTGKVFYLALTAGTYTNFGNTEVTQGINILKYNGSAWSLDAFIGIDDTPAPNSPKLVKSGGVFDKVMTDGSAFDISAHFASGSTLATYADLSAALTALNSLSASYKRGGMSIKFVQSSDNTYVQFRYMSSSTAVADFTNIANWQKLGAEVSVSQNTETGVNIITIGNTSYNLNSYIGINRGLFMANWGKLWNRGTLVTDNVWASTDILPLSQRIILNCYDGGSAYSNYGVQFFDADKHYISTYTSTESSGEHRAFALTENDYPTGAEYFAVSAQKNLLKKVFIVGVENGIITNIINQIDAVKEDLADTKVYSDLVKNLIWGCQFNGTTSYADLSEPISLSSNGDSLEISFAEVTSAGLDGGGFAFTKGGNDYSEIGLAVSKRYISLRADDGAWIFSNIDGLDKGSVKIEYANDNILLYVNGTLKSTYTGQKTMTVYSFGHGAKGNYGYWKGIINSIKVNDIIHSLNDIATLHDVTLYRENGFLYDGQAFDLKLSDMYVRKTSNALYVYRRYKNDDRYIEYPLKYRYKAYEGGETYPDFYDNWGIEGIGIVTIDANGITPVTELTAGAEFELAINTTRGDGESGVAYVGGHGHGFENIVTENGVRHISFIIDSQNVAEDSAFDLKPCNSVIVIQNTQLCKAYSNTNPFANAVKQWTFNKQGAFLKVSTTLLNDTRIVQLQSGMMLNHMFYDNDSTKGYLTNKAIKDSEPYKIFTCNSGWTDNDLQNPDSKCYKITEYGEKGYGFAMKSIEDNRIPLSSDGGKGGMFVWTNGSTTYNKIYLQLAGLYDGVTNDNFHSEIEWIIE